MAVKHLGKLTLDLVKEISPSNSDNLKQGLAEDAEIEMSNSELKEKFLVLIDQEKLHKQTINQVDLSYSKYAELAEKAAISTVGFIQPHFDNSSFELIEQQRMKKMDTISKKLSKSFDQARERKERIEKERNDQLVSALERSNSQQFLANENAQLKIEIEKLKQENSKLLKENNKFKKQGSIESTRAKNNVLDIIYVLVDMAELPIDNPFKAYGVMQLHADRKKLKIPSKDTVSKWLEDANNKNI